MQFTGLKDRNGKEIYEGDILRFSSEGGWEAQVVWVEVLAAFGLMPIEEDSGDLPTYDFEWLKQEKMKVSGNIWENPELLKA
jgi:uncharacterized phage protein (TIGR01671 family)